MFKDIFDYEILEECSPELYGFRNITMLKDFGPYKKGDKVDNLWFDLLNGEATEYEPEDGAVIRAFKFWLTTNNNNNI